MIESNMTTNMRVCAVQYPRTNAILILEIKHGRAESTVLLT
jgi:hypothetical protein